MRRDQAELVLARRTRGRSSSRGFTLTELMAVVAIMGVLGALAISIFRKNAFASNVSEAGIGLSSIKAAQEQYRSLNQVYADVSQNGWYPANLIGKNEQMAFLNASHADFDPDGRPGWRDLRAPIDYKVRFVFMVNAGVPADPLPALATPDLSIAAPAGAEPWFVAQARADADEDGVFCVVVATNFMSDIRSVNDGE